MAEFKYTHIKQLEPRPGNNFATAYYKQTDEQRELLQRHVKRVAAEIIDVCDDNMLWHEFMHTPLRGYKKQSRGEYYTPQEIVGDMLRQLEQKKDVPSGMLGRWQKLFAGTDYDIVMVSHREVKQNNYGKLFNYA